MTWDSKIGKQEQDQRTYENSAEARRVTITDGDGNNINIDEPTLSISTIDYEHHEVHQGSHYYLTDYTTLASDATLKFVVTTPNTTEWTHFTFALDSTGQTTVITYEDSTVPSTDVTPIVPFNNNRNSVNTSGLTVGTVVAFASSDGTKIAGRSFGIEANPAQIRGGNAERSKELVLKQNSTYVIAIASQSATNIVSYDASWYEHTSKA